MARLPTELVAFSAEQEEIVRLCRQFAQEEVRPVAREVDEADVVVPWEIWHKAAAIGLTSFMLPQELGGGGFGDVFTQCLVQEELCAGDLALGNLLTSNGFFAHPVLELGTVEQKERFLSPLVGPTPPLTSVAVTEPDVGSDAASLQTRAVRTAGGYRLTGRKTWISNAGPAELLRRLRDRGPVASRPWRHGLRCRARRRGPQLLRAVPQDGPARPLNAEMVLEDVFVPEADRLGEEGQGFHGLMHTFDASRVVLGAAATGAARAATEYAVDYAKERKQFGKPIIEHQSVAFRLADMATRVEAARLMVWRAAKRLDAGLRSTTEAAMAKLSRPKRQCSLHGQPCKLSAAGAIRASTSRRSGCATPSSRRSRRARPTSSGW